ncbi:hypothetical protein DICPUDRAFT_86183 [Dictyostelium purpureum]|uniref:TH1 domain-containing protein n=1 Tax=Dictyostelium purpureum TaxID=5786 RepID=F0ZA35_DICPU|nr:uncharacterized protein DICPUDRAFT_86183 [Dictyostelium purpureum]EGC39253.1 hypothetical protein DICPUDRAFT_86183 [Dictyostelium purpureum]|eukprot:XP_003284280.1 hypothetical protein DICPUDRAFT_86183 [Dictyostelium purpureum]
MGSSPNNNNNAISTNNINNNNNVDNQLTTSISSLLISQNNNTNNNNNLTTQTYNIFTNSFTNNSNNNNNGSLSPSSSIHNFSLLNDIYFQNTNNVNELVNKSSHGASISAGSIANINSGTSGSIHNQYRNGSGSGSGSQNSNNNMYIGNNGNIVSDEIGAPTYGVDLIVQTTKQEDSKFMGKKRRRNSSVSKVFLGDFLRLSNNVSILKMISKFGDNQILFSDVLIKVNKRNKMQERIIIITDKSIYNVNPKDYKLKRRISLENVTSLSMSTQEDNFIILHVNSEYDYVLVGSRKIEIATVLVESYHNLTFYQITPYSLNTNNNSNNNSLTSPSSPSPLAASTSSTTTTTTSPLTNNSTTNNNNNNVNNSHHLNINNSNTNTPNHSNNNSLNGNNGKINEDLSKNNIGILTSNSNSSNVSIIHRITGLVLPINFSDKIEYRIEGDSMREIVFTRVKGSVNISIQNAKSKPSLKKENSRISNTTPSTK